MTEDVFILDCQSDIFVWVGQQVDTKTKSLALTIGEVFANHVCFQNIEMNLLLGGKRCFWIVYLLLYSHFLFAQKFLEHDFLLEKLAKETSIFIVMEGREPQFFTRFFTWDSAKSLVGIHLHLSIWLIFCFS